MAFTIRSTLDSLVTLQAALSITSPISQTIKRAYKTVPKQDSMPETPCWINIPRLVRVSHVASARMQNWQIRSQLLVDDADVNQAADIALAYIQAFLDALSDAQTMNGLPLILGEITGGDLTGFERSGRVFTGIEVITTLQVPLESVTVGP